MKMVHLNKEYEKGMEFNYSIMQVPFENALNRWNSSILELKYKGNIFILSMK